MLLSLILARDAASSIWQLCSEDQPTTSSNQEPTSSDKNNGNSQEKVLQGGKDVRTDPFEDGSSERHDNVGSVPCVVLSKPTRTLLPGDSSLSSKEDFPHRKSFESNYEVSLDSTSSTRGLSDNKHKYVIPDDSADSCNDEVDNDIQAINQESPLWGTRSPLPIVACRLPDNDDGYEKMLLEKYGDQADETQIKRRSLKHGVSVSTRANDKARPSESLQTATVFISPDTREYTEALSYDPIQAESVSSNEDHVDHIPDNTHVSQQIHLSDIVVEPSRFENIQPDLISKTNDDAEEPAKRRNSLEHISTTSSLAQRRRSSLTLRLRLGHLNRNYPKGTTQCELSQNVGNQQGTGQKVKLKKAVSLDESASKVVDMQQAKLVTTVSREMSQGRKC